MSTTPTPSDTEQKRSQVFRNVTTVQCLQCALIAAIGMLTSACDRQTSPPAIAAEKGAAAETRAEAEKEQRHWQAERERLREEQEQLQFQLKEVVERVLKVRVVRLCDKLQCSAKHFGRGLCRNHYARWKRVT